MSNVKTDKSPGPFVFQMFKAADGSDCPGVKCQTTGAAVAWGAGPSDAASIANTHAIVEALNKANRAG